MVEVEPGIFMYREKGGLSAIKPEVNLYVIAGSEGLIFDAGYGTAKVVRGMVRDVAALREKYNRAGRHFKITRVMPSHSHPDHFSGLKRLSRHLGCRIVLTRKMAETLRTKEAYYLNYKTDPVTDYFIAANSFGMFRERLRNRFFRLINDKIYGLEFVDNADEIIPDESNIMINGENWKVFSSPGHAADHISLYNERKGILFAGDNILRTVTTWLGPPDSDLEAYMNSLRHIACLPRLRIILSAHGSPIRNPRERIAEILKYREKRTSEVYNLVKDRDGRGISAGEIVSRLYADDGRFKKEIARGWVVLTLKYLESKGLVGHFARGSATLFMSTERNCRNLQDKIQNG